MRRGWEPHELWLILAPACIFLAAARCVAQSRDGLFDEELRAIQRRQEIRSGHVRLVSSISGGTSVAVREIWFDGGAWRCDTDRNGPAPGGPLWRHCIANGKEFFWDYDAPPPGGYVAPRLMDTAAPGHKHFMPPLDVRMLGFSTNDSWNTAHDTNLNVVIGREDRQSATRNEVVVNERRLVEVAYERRNGVRFVIQLDPQRDYCPVLIHLTAGDDDNLRESIARCELRLHEPSQFWFPSLHESERRLNGETVEQHRCEIEVLSLNEPIDPQVFSMAAMELPVGNPVLVAHASPDAPIEEMVWNGTELVPSAHFVSAPLQAEGGGNAKFLGLAVLLALAGASFAWLSFRSRAAPSS